MNSRSSVFRLLSLLALAAAVSPSFGAAAAAPGPLDWPAITSQTKPWSRWWWLASIGTDSDFTSEMQKYAQAGLGGLEITPIYGVRGEESRFVSYLSPQWVKRLEYVLDEGQRLGLGLDMATGNGWPFGGPNVGPEDAAKYVARKSWLVIGGGRLAEPVVFVQQPVVHVAGPRQVTIGELKEPISANANLQDLALDQVRFEKKLPLQALMAYSDKGQKLDLTGKVGSDGTLDWTAPANANWTLYGIFIGWHGKQVERAGPGGEGNAIDHFSAAAFNHYIARFDQALGPPRLAAALVKYDRNQNGRLDPDELELLAKQANGDPLSGVVELPAFETITGDTNSSAKVVHGHLRAFFSDSYEVDDSLGESDWTEHFFEQFRQRRGYDLRDQLPAFFGQDTPEMNARVISDHRETISDLMYDEYMASWRKWAAGRGALIRDQAHGSPANVLDLYAAAGIPETEGADPLRMKFASSAAHVTGKLLASAETCTWLGEHYSSTLADAKLRVDAAFLGGINHVFYHGTAFSPPGEPWPGFHFYASAEFDPSNAFWPDFSILNGYVAHVQSFLQSTRPANDVLLYYPIYDRWAQRGDGAMPHFGGPQGTTAQEAGQTLLNRGYTFDFISDRLLKDVRVVHGALQTGGNAYKTIVVPETKLMPLPTLEKLVALAQAGATVIFQKGLPADVPGFGALEARRASLQQLEAKLAATKTDDDETSWVEVGSGRIFLAGSAERTLARAGVRREALVDEGLSFERRAHDGGYVYFLLNRGAKPFAGWIPLAPETKTAALFEPMTMQHGLATLRTNAQGAVEAYVQIAPADSVLVKTFAMKMDGPAYAYWTPGEARPFGGSWAVHFTSGGPELPAATDVMELKSWTDFGGDAVKAFSGTATYTLGFARPIDEAAAYQIDLGRVAESARVKLNGVEIAAFIKPPFRVALPAAELKAQNTLEIVVTNLSANRIADLDRRGVPWKRFYNTNIPARIAANRGPDGLFSAAKWTPRPSGLIGPVTLAPLAVLKP